MKKEMTGICCWLVPQTKFVERSMKHQVLEYPRCTSVAVQNDRESARESLHEARRTQLPACLVFPVSKECYMLLFDLNYTTFKTICPWFLFLSAKRREFILMLKMCCSRQTRFNFWINLTP